MRLKTLPLVILLALLLTLKGFTQTPPESQRKYENAFGIDVTQFYPGETVLELLLAAETEIDAAVQEAYAEGYKAAMLEYAPGAVTYKAEVELLREELKAERKKSRWLWPAIGVSTGFSFTAGFFLNSILTR